MSLLQTVLFADISRSSRLYEILGDEAAKAIIETCLTRLTEITNQHQGQVVKIIGDEIMAIFPDANDTVRAAFQMQESMTQYAATHRLQVGLRIGLNFGPVIYENDDIFGSTVNAAARMVAFAQSGQIITSQSTVKILTPQLQSQTRMLDKIPSPGKTNRMSVYQIIWERRELTTARTYLDSKTVPFTISLQLQYREQILQLSLDQSGFTIGRNVENDLMVSDDYTSRQHAQILVRKGKFILKDQSTNGTFILAPDDTHAFIQREEYILQNKGWIGLGEMRQPNHPEVIYFEILDVPMGG
ncbi:MAG: adenylate/guanylate cyclase domain-containing protein [Thermosynechococcaceae cyanobacterium MS004]|jgi:adenylate cyclase|nr:adenylate/guanylate cyclase domain-containing protein [Thermosynechococcaceae cyanobacterium MS004]